MLKQSKVSEERESGILQSQTARNSVRRTKQFLKLSKTRVERPQKHGMPTSVDKRGEARPESNSVLHNPTQHPSIFNPPPPRKKNTNSGGGGSKFHNQRLQPSTSALTNAQQPSATQPSGAQGKPRDNHHRSFFFLRMFEDSRSSTGVCKGNQIFNTTTHHVSPWTSTRPWTSRRCFCFSHALMAALSATTLAVSESSSGAKTSSAQRHSSGFRTPYSPHP